MTRNLLISGSKEKEKRKVRKEPNRRYSPLTEKNSWGRKNPDQIRPQFAQKLQNLQSRKEKAIFLLLTTPLSLSLSLSLFPSLLCINEKYLQENQWTELLCAEDLGFGEWIEYSV